MTRITPPLLVSLALLTAVAPFATDLYLPAFPDMIDSLDASAASVQLSLTAFLVGAGVGQVFFGPLADRVGRLPPLLIGCVLFVIASAAAALAPTIQLLVAARLLQGIAGASGMVISRTVISDIAHGREAASAFSTLMMVGGVAPVLAPVAGSLLAGPVGWRGILWVVTGLGVLTLGMVLSFVPETHGPEARAEAGEPPSLRQIARALLAREYLAAMAAFAFAFASMMAYISASPFVYQGIMGLSALQFGVAFGLNALALMVVSGIAAKLTATVGVHRLGAVGLSIHLVSVVALAVLVFAAVPPLWLALPIFVSVGSLGLVFGTTTALALDAVPSASGYASAVLGLVQFVLAGAVAPLVGIAGEGSAVPVALVMLATSLIANVAYRAALRTAASSVIPAAANGA